MKNKFYIVFQQKFQRYCIFFKRIHTVRISIIFIYFVTDFLFSNTDLNICYRDDWSLLNFKVGKEIFLIHKSQVV